MMSRVNSWADCNALAALIAVKPAVTRNPSKVLALSGSPMDSCFRRNDGRRNPRVRCSHPDNHSHRHSCESRNPSGGLHHEFFSKIRDDSCYLPTISRGPTGSPHTQCTRRSWARTRRVVRCGPARGYSRHLRPTASPDRFHGASPRRRAPRCVCRCLP